MENLDPNQPISEKPTVIFEARLRPFIEDELNSNHLKLAHAQLSNLIQELEVENVICNIDNDMLPLLAQLSDAWKLWASQEIESLVPVEIIAIENQEKPSHLRLRDVLSRFCVYRMHGVPPPPPRLFEGSDSTTSIEAYDDPEIPSAEVFDMPHHDFDGKWEELIFDQNHKEDLSWMISNILTFSADTGHAKKRMNPMALFHGPPGTGKTTICQAIAQRLAIRLVETFPHTKLIQVKTATLLSKYFSESATQVDDLLNKVKIMCQNNPSRIIIVLIDEVESIAVSRHSGVMHGEAQDSLRATNSLLTGLDTVMTCPNVVFMSTSNMIDCLDEAFVDRCAIRIPFQPPSEESQYKILKASVLELIRREIIIADLSNLLDSTQLIQSWQEATLYTAFQNDSATGKLLNIIMQLNSPTAKNKLGISGRFLTQIPEQALMKCARPNKSLTLDVALDCIEKFVQDLLTARGGQKRKLSEVEAEVQPGAKHYCYCAAEKDE
ncbi:hypothetical protein sscle_02g012660 [Sclerotinia sclerotiorum 1980 UF-70]|uniref:AAA+ ATPase domain-containing protein n=1 Tax=Sclerotinia sclerotiorum (strain ATCC 18683 / 1980 / Ss-1) TaxID=665079 RepID=A0A1D9PV17_SCLS1|nr:hypothetical protein sscle_02g012660 [Sclerotinia sclerotiorum 1980 UF-70]